MAAVTALGDLEGRAAVRRSGARAGDTVAYAGRLGLAGLGLARLFAESAEQGVAHARGLASLRERHPAALRAQLAPEPPIRLGAVAAEAGATAMLDVSDGLALDAARIAEAGGVALDLDAALLVGAFGEQRGETVPLDAMLFGGEDHGLLATFPRGVQPPEGFVRIGAVRGRPTADEAVLLLDGRPCEPGGWDPFAAGQPGA